jgi:DNA primase
MIEELLEHIGIEDLQPGDTEIGGRCPLHEKRTGERERRPRHFFVNRSTGAFHCFSCDYGGSLIRLITDLTKVGLWDAHQLLHRFDVELNETDQETRDLYHGTSVPSADLEAQLDQFGLPPERAIDRRKLKLESIAKFKVRWDYEESAWILPIYGPSGELWGWQAKTAEYVRNRPPGIRKSLTLFGIHAQTGGDSIILVESPLDVVYLDGLGYQSVASFGAAVSDVQMRLLIENFDELILALDNDRVGRNEMQRLLGERWHHRMSVQVFNYWALKRKDPGELTPEQIDNGMSGATLAGFW